MTKFPINPVLQRIAISGLLKDASVPLTSAFLITYFLLDCTLGPPRMMGFKALYSSIFSTKVEICRGSIARPPGFAEPKKTVGKHLTLCL